MRETMMILFHNHNTTGDLQKRLEDPILERHGVDSEDRPTWLSF